MAQLLSRSLAISGSFFSVRDWSPVYGKASNKNITVPHNGLHLFEFFLSCGAILCQHFDCVTVWWNNMLDAEKCVRAKYNQFLIWRVDFCSSFLWSLLKYQIKIKDIIAHYSWSGRAKYCIVCSVFFFFISNYIFSRALNVWWILNHFAKAKREKNQQQNNRKLRWSVVSFYKIFHVSYFITPSQISWLN